MSSVIAKLSKKELIRPPKWMAGNMCMEVQMGSVAYGVNTDNSDIDVYGFCIPPKGDIFPHLRGEVVGFGTPKQRFAQYDPHHIKDTDSGKEYDLAIYSIVKYFSLVMGNNPNMIDSLFVPRRCVLFSSEIGEMVRDRRKMFLHKGAWHKFKGYAYSRLGRMESARVKSNRVDDIERLGYDTKCAYHLVRLILEVEQILVEHDLDITRHREQLKSIRRGEWSLEYLFKWFEDKVMALEAVYTESTLPCGPDEDAVRTLLLDCLEHHYGSLETAVKRDVKVDDIINDLQNVIDRYS